MVNAEIILIGTEVLTGNVRDKNARHLSGKLTEAGFTVQRVSFIRDVQKDLESSIRQAAERASLILTTGGLGIGNEDVTRKAVSHVVGRRLTLNEKLLEYLDRGVRRHRQEGSQSYSRKALVPARSRILTASGEKVYGFAMHWRDAYVVCLPGNPEEVERLFEEAVGPYLSDRFKRGSITALRTLHTAGLTESGVRDRLEDLLHPRAPISIKIYSLPAGVDVQISSTGRSDREARQPLDPIEERLRGRLGEACYGSDRQSLETVVAGLLTQKGLRLAIAESCTGGLVSHRLTNIPGSSAFLDRTCVCYSDRSKTDLLGVTPEVLREHGAVSASTAEAMARGVRARSGADVGMAITGIAGPTGGSPGKPVGLVFFGLASGDSVRTSSVRYQGRRKTIKEMASQGALDLLRRHLQGVL